MLLEKKIRQRYGDKIITNNNIISPGYKIAHFRIKCATDSASHDVSRTGIKFPHGLFNRRLGEKKEKEKEKAK